MKKLVFILLLIVSCSENHQIEIIIDESDQTESVVQRIEIDSVWSGHRVNFSLLTLDT